MKNTIQTIIEANYFKNLITFLILFNGVALGLATSQEIMLQYGTLLNSLDNIIIAVFTLEIIMRIYVHM